MNHYIWNTDFFKKQTPSARNRHNFDVFISAPEVSGNCWFTSLKLLDARPSVGLVSVHVAHPFAVNIVLVS